MSYNSISDYIDNIPLEATLCKGYKPDDVYEVMCNISSMYNELLSKAYKELDDLQMEKGVNLQAPPVTEYRETAQNIRTEEEEIRTPEPVEIMPAIQMTDKELQKLKRVDLLELLLDVSRDKEILENKLREKDESISALKERLERREIDLAEAGTIAEASFKLNGVYSATEKAAQQYLDNIKRLHDREKTGYAAKEKEVYEKCQSLIASTEKKCKSLKDTTVKSCEEMIASTEKKCQQMMERARAKSDIQWEQLSQKLDVFYSAHEDLKDFLAVQNNFRE